MSYDTIASSRRRANPVTLFYFQGDDATEFQLENLIRSVTIIPGTTEFGYGTTKVTETNANQPQNYLANSELGTDFTKSLAQLLEQAPNINHVSLVVAWHGNDLRIGNCTIKPRIEAYDRDTSPYSWQVGPTTRGAADIVTYIGGRPAAGGAPSDRTVWEALTAIKAAGLKVTLYPFILMDIASSNTLPNPYSDNAAATGQSAYPWRGRITVSPAYGYAGSPDGTATAATQVANFIGTAAPGDFGWDGSNKHVTYSGPNEWTFRRFILHMATIADAVGVDDFLIGSEMIGMTQIRSGAGVYPAVDALVDLAADVKGMLGSGTRVSYAADWSEYHSDRRDGEIYFHLDPLWASDDIDFVGIDNYLPIADWREGDTHLDLFEGWRSIYDLDYLRKNIESGENYDWYYASSGDRNSQTRTPITDPTYNKPWVWRNKDIRNWWANEHYNRPSGTEAGSPTDWVAQSKPIVFTELGCAAVNKGANQPNVFIDPKSSESFYPYFSTQRRDQLMQRAFLEANLTYWEGDTNPVSIVYDGPMLDMDTLSIWTWDARPFPTFPKREDFWGDAFNWEVGHWLNGRLQKVGEPVGRSQVYAYTDAERPFTYRGVVYQPIPIKLGEINSTGKLDKSLLEVRIPRTAEITDEFRIYPPSQPITLIIKQGQRTDPDGEFLAVWTGRVLASAREGNESVLSCEPLSSSMRRPGLRRNYQIGCPYVLYGDGCRANKAAATRSTTVSAINNSTQAITLPGGWEGSFSPGKFIGGMVEWITEDGTKEIRKILRRSGNVLTLSGYLRGLDVGYPVDVILGCNHQTSDCENLHDNIRNYGGFPTIPLTNPLGAGTNNYY